MMHKINELTYDLDLNTKEATVSGAAEEIEGTLTIPSAVQNADVVYRVTTIGKRAFYGRVELTSIALPDSITSIGEEAFHDTAWYNSHPDGLVYIGNVLYSYKGKMPLDAEVVIKPGTTCICDSAFQFREEMKSVTIPNTVTHIGKQAFVFCRGLTSLTIPEGVTAIGWNAFMSCTSLISISLPRTLCHINEDFSLCDNLQTIYIPQGMTDYFCQLGLSTYRDKLVEI